MNLRSNSFQPYQFINEKYAFGKFDPETKFTFAGNVNPHLAWDQVPEGTKSFALLCYDPDVPSVGDDVNQEGKTVALDLPRVDFFHWVVTDLPADLREVQEGAHAEGVVAKGKEPGSTPNGGLQGVNNYTDWFAGDENMGGAYAGYDGPAPPWNDERVHSYHFVVYALDVESLELDGEFTGGEVRDRMEGHVLASAELVGLYAINPDAREAHRKTL